GSFLGGFFGSGVFFGFGRRRRSHLGPSCFRFGCMPLSFQLGRFLLEWAGVFRAGNLGQRLLGLRSQSAVRIMLQIIFKGYFSLGAVIEVIAENLADRE